MRRLHSTGIGSCRVPSTRWFRLLLMSWFRLTLSHGFRLAWVHRIRITSRLVSGAKARVDPSAAKRLTSKNYQRLPEVQKAKEDVKRKEAEAANKRRIAALQREMNERIRNNLKKKRGAQPGK